LPFAVQPASIDGFVMGNRNWALFIFATCCGSAVLLAEDDGGAPPETEIVVSVAEQKLALVRDGGLVKKYPVSTSKFGIGDSFNSYRTPLGRLRVCNKIGDDLALGAVLKSRSATGEILPANAPGRDPIVTRILWLEGLESCNANAKSRGIYIHGTVEENKLGQPVSYGCIRMRSRDVVELFDEIPVGTPVSIVADRFPRFQKATPKPELILASNDNVTTTTTTVGPHGMIVVRTGRGGATVAAAKPDAEETPKVPAKVAAKPAETPTKAIAKVEPVPQPIAEGPTIVFSTPKLSAPPARIARKEGDAEPAEPRVLLAMSGSILMSGVEARPKAAPAPAPRPTAAETTAPAAPRVLFLEIIPARDLFAQADGAQPLDALSGHLLNPPQPQVRLAFRTSVPEPEL
jgi:hypothetical protein